jgi:hypothetical protein
MQYVRIRVRTGPDGDLENLNRFEREQTRKRRAEGDRFSRAALGIFGIAAIWLEWRRDSFLCVVISGCVERNSIPFANNRL